MSLLIVGNAGTSSGVQGLLVSSEKINPAGPVAQVQPVQGTAAFSYERLLDVAQALEPSQGAGLLHGLAQVPAESGTETMELVEDRLAEGDLLPVCEQPYNPETLQSQKSNFLALALCLPHLPAPVMRQMLSQGGDQGEVGSVSSLSAAKPLLAQDILEAPSPSLAMPQRVPVHEQDADFLLESGTTAAASTFDLTSEGGHDSAQVVEAPDVGVEQTGVSMGISKRSLAVVAAAQPLVQVLAQRIQLQQVQGTDVVTVRLDPPHLGTLEIRIQSDVAGVQVQMQASHAEVSRQLAGIADSLRQELQMRTAGDAAVTVSAPRSFGAQSQGQQESQHPRHQAWQQSDETISQALRIGDESSSS